MVKPPNPSLPRFHAQPVQAGSLHSEKADSPSPPSPLEPASLAQTDGASTAVKVISALALVPLLYCIRAYLLTPVAHWIGHGLVNTFNNQPTVVTAAGQGLHSLGKRELEKGSGEFIAFACLIPILVILSVHRPVKGAEGGGSCGTNRVDGPLELAPRGSPEAHALGSRHITDLTSESDVSHLSFLCMPPGLVSLRVRWLSRFCWVEEGPRRTG